jgi:hypothetical protein
VRIFTRPANIHERMLVNLKAGRLALYNTPHFHRQLRHHVKLCRLCKDLLLEAMLHAAAESARK